MSTVQAAHCPSPQPYLVPVRSRSSRDVYKRQELYGPKIVPQLVGDFQHPWPTATLRVEIVAYANFGGAYTTENPPLIAMSSLDLEQQGDDALEELSLIHI